MASMNLIKSSRVSDSKRCFAVTSAHERWLAELLRPLMLQT